MKELLRVSPHQPIEVVVVKKERVASLLASGLYKEVGAEKTKFDKEESPELVFSHEMTEKEIKNLINFNEISIDYDIKRDTKRETLLKLKGLGYAVVLDGK